MSNIKGIVILSVYIIECVRQNLYIDERTIAKNDISNEGCIAIYFFLEFVFPLGAIVYQYVISIST